MRSAELTLPGYIHDVCSTVQGTSVASPFFAGLDLDEVRGRARPPADPAGPSVGRRPGRAPGAVRPGHGGWAGRRWPGLPATVRPARPGGRPDPAVHPWPEPAHPAPSRSPWRASAWGHSGRPHRFARRRFRDEPAQCAVRRAVRAFDGRPRPAGDRLLRTRPGDDRPRLRLAGRPWRHAAARRRPRGGAPGAGRRDRHRTPRHDLDELPAARAILFDTTPRALVSIAGPALKGGYRRRLSWLPLRPGGRQG